MKRYLSCAPPALLLVVVLMILASCGGSSSSGGSQASETTGGTNGAGSTTTEMANMDHGSGQMQAMNMQTVDPATAGVQVLWASDPEAPLPGQLVTLRYRVSDAQSGQVLTDLPIDHERPMHLIALSKDLEQFQHIHPEPGDDEAYGVTTTFPENGMYVLYDEFVYNGQTVLDRHELPVGNATDTSTSLTPDLSPKTVNGVTVNLLPPQTIRAGEEARFTFDVSRDERPIIDLEPYLGAAAHVAVVSEDTNDFAHVHGEAGEGSGETHEDMESMESPPSAFGPEISFHHTFPHRGLYKIWGQFSYGGDVITTPFVVEVQ